MAPVLLAACQNVPSLPDWSRWRSRALEAAPPTGERRNSDRPEPRARVHAAGCHRNAEIPPPPTPSAGGQAGDITLNFVETGIREIARTILGATLKAQLDDRPALNFRVPLLHGPDFPQVAESVAAELATEERLLARLRAPVCRFFRPVLHL
jgi:hypothetical protein